METVNKGGGKGSRKVEAVKKGGWEHRQVVLLFCVYIPTIFFSSRLCALIKA